MMLTNGKKTMLNCVLAFTWLFIGMFSFDIFTFPNDNIFTRFVFFFFGIYGVFIEGSFTLSFFEYVTDKKYRITLT